MTIISFLTKNNYPIYDKFASKALDAISGKVDFRDIVQYKELPDKSYIAGVIKRYREYKNLLTELYGDEWKDSRDIDRALWVYGHMI